MNMMDGDKVALKRARNPSGQNEEHRKLFRHLSMDEALESGREWPLGRSASDTSAAVPSFSIPSFDGATNSSQNGDHAEPMETNDCSNEPVTVKGKKKEKVSQRTKEPKSGPDLSTKKKANTDYVNTISIERGHKIAQYEINIRLCEGPWKEKKSYRASAKDDLLKYINAAGNSYGNRVIMDCTDTNFGHKEYKGDLDKFYKDVEHNELCDLVGDELVYKVATFEKELALHVPMFKKFRSLKTNVYDPKFESVKMKNDDLCPDLLHDVQGGIRDSSKRQFNFNKSEDTMCSFLKDLKYGTTINCGKESPAIQFKYLKPEKKQDFAKDCFNERNKLQKYVSAFATYDGGVVLYGIMDETGFAEGQILSSDKSELHSFDKISEYLKEEIPKHTKWWDPHHDNSASHIKNFFSITEYPIPATSIPETVRSSKELASNEYLAVICIRIKPFVDLDDPSGPRDGIVFASGDGPEAYRIDAKKLLRLSFEEWLKEITVKSGIEHITDGLRRMHLEFYSAVDGRNIFEVPDSTRSIRERMFRSIFIIISSPEPSGSQVISLHLVLEDTSNEQQFYLNLREQCLLQDSQINEILDSYIRMVGSFPNSTLKHKLGVEVLNVLTDKQFDVLASMDSCRRLWVHGLPGSGKTVLAVMLIKHLVKRGEGPVLFVAENQGLISKIGSHLEPEVCGEIACISRKKFVNCDMEGLSKVRSIVMDEVHHYRVEHQEPSWYERAVRIVSGKGREGRWSNGYLWFFVDMFQKENNFPSGIPDLTLQEPKKALTEVIRCSCSIWAAVKEMLRRVTIYPADHRAFYNHILSKSSCPHTVEGQEVEVCTSADRPDNSFGLPFQVVEKVQSLLDQHWRAEDIGILFSVKEHAENFALQYNSLSSSSGIQLVSCTEDTPNRIVCDSVRRFAGMEKPCIILVEPSVKELYFSATAFEALGMSRAMMRLIVIKKKTQSKFRRQQSQI